MPHDVELVEGDLRPRDTSPRAGKGVTYLIHQAALPSVSRSIDDPQTGHELKATSTLNLPGAGLGAGAEGLVYASSSSIYGPAPMVPLEDSDRPEPISGYAAPKVRAEHCRTTFCHLHD